MRRVWWCGSIGRVLLSGMRSTGEGQGRLSKDCQPRQYKDGLVLRTKEIWLQEAIASRTAVPHVEASVHGSYEIHGDALCVLPWPFNYL